jgi:hypothetical protein
MSRGLTDPVEPVVESSLGLPDVFGLLVELLDRFVVLEERLNEVLERLDG